MSRATSVAVCQKRARFGFLAGLLFIGAAAGCSSISDEELMSIKGAIDIKEGLAVADVGAGDGVLIPHLASWVGRDGEVFATEIDTDKVGELQELALQLSLQNVQVSRGTPTDSGLGSRCCDAIVTRMVYHHFTDPVVFIDNLYDALKPGGHLLIIDFQPSIWMSSSTPDGLPKDREGQHGVSPESVIKEVSEQGFSMKQRFDEWPGPGGIVLNHFAVLFVRN